MDPDPRQIWTPNALDAARKARLRGRVPFAYSAFSDRDDLGWMRRVLSQGKRHLYGFFAEAMIWIEVEEEQVVRLDIVEGRAATRLWQQHGLTLPAERADSIAACLEPGRDLGEALRAAFGPQLIALQDVDTRHREDGALYIFRVCHENPHRRGVLRVETNADERIVEAELLDGQRGSALLATVKAR